MSRMQRFECAIDFGQRELGVKAVLLKRPPNVIYYELFDDTGEDVTIEYYREDDHEAIKKLILEEWKYDQTAEKVMDEIWSPTLAEVNFRRGY